MPILFLGERTDSMLVIIPEEIKELVKLYEPYKEGCDLRKDAPEFAKEAYKRVDHWFETRRYVHER